MNVTSLWKRTRTGRADVIKPGIRRHNGTGRYWTRAPRHSGDLTTNRSAPARGQALCAGRIPVPAEETRVILRAPLVRPFFDC